MEGVLSETEELLLTLSQSILSLFDNHDVASSVSSGPGSDIVGAVA